jgi:hypothetical protein
MATKRAAEIATAIVVVKVEARGAGMLDETVIESVVQAPIVLALAVQVDSADVALAK